MLVVTSSIQAESRQISVRVRFECSLRSGSPRTGQDVSQEYPLRNVRVLDLVQRLVGLIPAHDMIRYQLTLSCLRLALWSWSWNAATTDRRGSKISTTAIPFLSGQTCPIQNRSTSYNWTDSRCRRYLLCVESRRHYASDNTWIVGDCWWHSALQPSCIRYKEWLIMISETTFAM